MHLSISRASSERKGNIRVSLPYKKGEQRNVQGEEMVFGQRPTHEQTSFQDKTHLEFLGVVKDFKH